MQVRKPIVAGQFYPADEQGCIEEVQKCLEERPLPELPEKIVSGIVPHAGWVFSGSLAGCVFAAIKKANLQVETFIILGAAHSYFGPLPGVFDNGYWETPLGQIEIDKKFAEAVTDTEQAVSSTDAHLGEHSIEVQVPFIQYLFPQARLVPIIVPPVQASIGLGKRLAEIILSSESEIVCVGSTDLTHYGPRYGFEPQGTGSSAIRWASEVNDQKFIEQAVRLKPDKMLSTASMDYNACGAGAAAAAVETARSLGKTKGVLLAHSNSNEIMQKSMGTSSAESVGYAGIIF